MTKDFLESKYLFIPFHVHDSRQSKSYEPDSLQVIDLQT